MQNTPTAKLIISTYASFMYARNLSFVTTWTQFR